MGADKQHRTVSAADQTFRKTDLGLGAQLFGSRDGLSFHTLLQMFLHLTPVSSIAAVPNLFCATDRFNV